MAGLLLSAVAGAALLHWSMELPALGLAALATLAAFLWPQWVARAKLRRLLSSGNVAEILEVWNAAVQNLPHYRTVGPIVKATALAAHGMTERARGVLSRAERGRAWDSALDHRLFVETLIDTFEGERERALHKAKALTLLPLPSAPWARQRALVLRNAAGALARAFAHCSEEADAARLRAASKDHPLVHWAMRYALAVIRLDQGKRSEALALISQAPKWPEGSLFRDFQVELVTLASS